MRGWGLLTLAATAACNPPGLTLDVAIDDPGIKSVELFIGQHCGDDCPRATTPPGLSSMAIDDAYIVKDPTPFRAVDTEFTDGVAGFRIETDQDTTLDILVVVGYDAQGTIKWSRTFGGVPVSHSDTSHWRVELEPTAPITPTFQTQPSGTERIARWAQPAASTPACLLIEHWSDAPTPNRDLVVPDADHDCDGVAAVNECAPWIPNATGALPTIDAANCVLNTDTSGNTVCTLGGPQCTEDPSMMRLGCVPLDTTYCTPSALCQCAAQADQAACLRSVVTNGTSATSFMPFLKCVIAVDASGNRCDDAQIEIDGGPFLFNSRKCTSIGIADGELPVGPFGLTLALGEAKLELKNFVEPCKVDVEWHAGTAPSLSFGVLDLALDNKNHLAVPARIEISSGCTGIGTSGCALTNNVSSDTMFACVQASTPSSCLPDNTHGCDAGPYCNGQCCGFGEQCVNGTCMCGGQPACVGGNSCQTGLPNETQCGSVCCGAIGPCPV